MEPITNLKITTIFDGIKLIVPEDLNIQLFYPADIVGFLLIAYVPQITLLLLRMLNLA